MVGMVAGIVAGRVAVFVVFIVVKKEEQNNECKSHPNPTLAKVGDYTQSQQYKPMPSRTPENAFFDVPSIQI
jgi:hypothetical protein